MPVIISMLRGINLGGRRIGMEDLRQLYESLGFKEVRTYVASGNVVFKTTERDSAKLAMRIEKAIQQRFGFLSEVILRTTSEMREVIARNPFAGRRGIEPNRLLVTFLAGDPDKEGREKVLAIKAEPEELHLHGREIYIYYTNGMARPKVPWTAVAKLLKTPGTGRNWNTVVKLLEMAEALEARP